MEKVGALHVDWAVSISLFLLFVISVLLLFRPGLLPDYDGSSLTGLVEQELLDATLLRYEYVPVSFITNAQSNSSWTHARIVFQNPVVFPFCDKTASHYVLFNADGSLLDPIDYQFNLNDLSCNDNDVPLSNSVVRVIFGGLSPSSPYSFIIAHSSETKISGAGLYCSQAVCDEIVLGSVNQGVRVTKKGMSSSLLDKVLNDYVDNHYADVKTSIKFPRGKEFRVCETSISDDSCHPKDIVVPRDANVYSQSLSNALINGTSGELEGRSDIIIQAW